MPAGVPTGVDQTMYQYNDVQQRPRTEQTASTGVQPQQQLQQQPRQQLTGEFPQSIHSGTASQQPAGGQPQATLEPQGVVPQQTTVEPQSTRPSQAAVQPPQDGVFGQQPPSSVQQLPVSGQQPPQSFQQVPAAQQRIPVSARGFRSPAQQLPPSPQGAQQLPVSAQQPLVPAQQAQQSPVPAQYGYSGGAATGRQFEWQGNQSQLTAESQSVMAPQGSEPHGGDIAQQPIQGNWQESTLPTGNPPATSQYGVQGQFGSQQRTADPSQGAEFMPQQPVSQQEIASQQGVLGQQASTLDQQASTLGQHEAAGGQIGGAVGQQGAAVGQQGLQAAGTQELEQSPRKQRQHLTGMPNVDILETPDTVTIFADVPGSESDDLEIFANDNSITLLAKRDEEEMDEDAEVILQERPTEFKRSITLPAVADVDAAEATHEDGACRITLPKREEDKQKRIGFQ